MIQRHKERSSEMKKEKPNKQLTKKKRERDRKKEETFVKKRVLGRSKNQERPTSQSKLENGIFRERSEGHEDELKMYVCHYIHFT